MCRCQTPLVLDAALDTSYATWAVPIQVGTRTGYFLVGFNYPHSGVSRAWLGKDSPAMSVGGIGLGRALPQSADQYRLTVAGRPIVGLLGADALSRFALGFDWTTQRVTLWRRLSPQAATAFVGGSALRVPLGRRPNGTPAIEAMRGGRRIRLALWSHYVASFLPAADRLPEDVALSKSFAENDRGRRQRGVPLIVTPSLSLGPLSSPWTVCALIDDFGAKDVQGAYPINTGVQGRVVVDFPGKAFVVRARTRDEQIATYLSRILKANVKVEGGSLVMRAWKGQPNDAARRYWEGAEIVHIGTLDPKEVVTALSGPRAVAMIRTLFDLQNAGFRVAALVGAGARQTRSYAVPPYR